MPGKRYIVYYAPIERINGKMARTAQKVSNVAEGKTPSANAFYYGYRRRAAHTNSIGLRELPRDLSTNPYTNQETANKQLFSQSIAAAKVVNSNPSIKAKAFSEFRKQNKYVYFFGYIVAECRKNNGTIPQRWQ